MTAHACLLVGLGVGGLFLGHRRLPDVDDLQWAAGVPGEPGGGVDDGRGLVVGADGDDDRRGVGRGHVADRREGRRRRLVVPGVRLRLAQQPVAAGQDRYREQEGGGAEVEGDAGGVRIPADLGARRPRRCRRDRPELYGPRGPLCGMVGGTGN
ncbi:hypothetical protein [Streptomyces canarius]|uniref:hypothetical protein n=1 Tax=Streptomyces TaxID=1883 RepID=UPI0035714452